MIKSKKASVVIFALMLGMVIIILALALAPALQESISTTMNTSSGDTFGLDCNNESISNFDKGACLATDLTLFYYIGALIFIGGLVIASKITFG